MHGQGGGEGSTAHITARHQCTNAPSKVPRLRDPVSLTTLTVRMIAPTDTSANTSCR